MAGNSIHKINARKTNPSLSPTRNNTGQIATVFDWENASREERARIQRVSQEIKRARGTQVVKKRVRKASPLLSELEFVTEHRIHPKSFNQMVKALKKLHKLREKDRRIQGRIILDPEIIATFIRRLEGKEKINVRENAVVAFSNWALGRDVSKVVLLKLRGLSK